MIRNGVAVRFVSSAGIIIWGVFGTLHVQHVVKPLQQSLIVRVCGYENSERECFFLVFEWMKKKPEGKYICVSHFQCLGEKIAQNSCSYFLSDSFVQSSQCHSIPPALCTSFRRKRTRVSLSGEKDKAVAVLDPPNSSSLLILSLFRHKTGQKRIFCV